MSIDFSQVHTASDARTNLNSTLQRFRSEGVSSEPVVFGSHRRPEAVVVPWELYERLLPAINDALLVETVRARIASPNPSIDFDDAVRQIGFEPSEFE